MSLHISKCHIVGNHMSWLNYDTFQKANNKGADQFARMRRLVCVFTVRKPLRQGFSHRSPLIIAARGALLIVALKEIFLKASLNLNTVFNII